MTEINIILSEKLSTNKIYTMHHMPKSEWNNELYRAVKVAVIQQKIKPIQEYPIICTYVFYIAGKTLDILNLGGMAKTIEDGLRYSNIIKDDSLKYIKQVTLLEERSDKNYSYVVLEIN